MGSLSSSPGTYARFAGLVGQDGLEVGNLSSDGEWERCNGAFFWSEGSMWDSATFADGGPRILILFSGEIYNAEEVWKKLGAAGPVPSAPALLISRAYKRWGEGCFGYIDGIFSCAIYNVEEKLLHLYRDPIGTAGLYISECGGGRLAFSTSLRLFSRMPGVALRIDRSALHEYLRFLDVAPPRTIFEGVRQVGPGELFVWRAGLLRRTALSYQVSGAGQAPRDLEEATSRLDSLLRQAVEKRMEKGGTGFFLSGGIDSGLLTAVGATLDRENVTAYTVGFHEQGLDETPVADRVASHLGIRHEKLYFPMSEFHMSFRNGFSTMEQPFADPAFIPTLLKFDVCRQQVLAVVEGTGADGLVGEMPPRYKRVALRVAAPLPKRLRLGVASGLRVLPKVRDHAGVFDFEHPAELFIRWKGWTRKEIESLCEERVCFDDTAFFRTFQKNKHRSPLRLAAALLRAMPDDRIHQAARRFNLPVRFPYWDSAVEAYLTSLPDNFLYQDGVAKLVLRKLYARYVPAEFWDGPKHGFNFPFVRFMADQDYRILEELLGEDVGNYLVSMDKSIIKLVVEEFKKGNRDLAFKVWGLVVLSAWLRENRLQA